MRLIFMGTPQFAVPSLERLLSDGHDVAAVYTQPDKPAGRGKTLHQPPVKTLAVERGIPVYQPSKVRKNEEVRAIFEKVAADVCIVAAYGKILPEWLLSIPMHGCINVHASLLPKYRGAAPVNWAIANGETETGVTIMQLDAGMDTGPMIATRATTIGDNETAPELSSRLAQLGAQLLGETLPSVERAEAKRVPQDDQAATYAPMLKREDGLIDWRMPAREIANRARAFQPWPGTYTTFRGARLIFWRAKEIVDAPDFIDSQAGRVVRIDKEGIVVSCAGSTALLVEEIQLEGKRRVTGREFASGARLQAGENIAS